MRAFIIVAALAFTPAAFAQAVSSNEAMAAFQVAGIKASGIDKAVDDCGVPAKPTLTRVSLGGTVGAALKIEIASRTCYDRYGKHIWLLKQEGRSFKLIFEARTLAVTPLATKHNNAADIKLTMPESDQPVWIWNGTQYVFSKNELK